MCIRDSILLVGQGDVQIVIHGGALVAAAVGQFRVAAPQPAQLVPGGQGRGGDVPVSYTHLDVYKRQDQALNQKIDAYIAENKEQLLQDIAALVAIDSVEGTPEAVSYTHLLRAAAPSRMSAAPPQKMPVPVQNRPVFLPGKAAATLP